MCVSLCIFMCIFPVSDTDKEKLCLGDTGDLGGGGSDMGPSAALTPAIWEKTIPYDGESFHLEYMDLEEFLMENGIPTSPEENLKGTPEGDAMKTENQKATSSAQTKITKLVSPLTLLPIQELDKSQEEVVIITKSDSDITCDVVTGEAPLGPVWCQSEQSVYGGQKEVAYRR